MGWAEEGAGAGAFEGPGWVVWRWKGLVLSVRGLVY